MPWTFEGKLIEGPIAYQYPNLSQSCVADTSEDDAIWEQLGKATAEHANLLEELRTASNDQVPTLLERQEYRAAFGDLGYAAHCLSESIRANLKELHADPEEMKMADPVEVGKVRVMGETSQRFVQLVLQRYGEKDTLQEIEVVVEEGNWAEKMIECLTDLTLQVTAMFGRLKEHEREINELASECVNKLERLASQIVAATSRA
jgi:hypothetical protein